MIHKSHNLTFILSRKLIDFFKLMPCDPHVYSRKSVLIFKVFKHSVLWSFYCCNHLEKWNFQTFWITGFIDTENSFLSIWLYNYSRVVFCGYSTHRPVSTVVAILQVNLGFSNEVVHPDQVPVIDLDSK